MSTFKLDIISSDRHFFSGECESAILPAIDGEHGVLPGHENMVTAIKSGDFRMKLEGQWRDVAVSDGFADINADHVMIIVDTAEWPEEIDYNRAMRAKQRAEDKLRQKQSLREHYHTQAALSRAMTRLKLTKK